MITVDIDLEANAVAVILDRIETEIVVDKPSVSIGVPGLTGPRGPAGQAPYRHTQASPSATWTISHNLNRHPAVTIVLTSIGWVTSDIEYIDDNHLTIVFPTAVTGTADM